MTTYSIIFCLSFISIFLRSFQQKNVIHKRRALVLPTSYFLAGAECMVPAIFVTNFIDGSVTHIILMILAVGTGGGLGCLTSLDAHEWITKRIYKWHKKGDKDANR